jgi:DNA-binding transcriptional ArsR family regulator
MDTTDLVLHPVRLRIVLAMSDEQPITTTQLCARLPDVSKATVYRHVALLAEGGLLAVVGEERVRGNIVERRYRLNRSRSVIDDDAAAAMTLDDHRRGFTAATATLLAEFNAYLDREGSNPFADAVSYRQFPLWLSHDELMEMIDEMRTVIRSRLDNTPSPERTRHLLATILFPAEEPQHSQQPRP